MTEGFQTVLAVTPLLAEDEKAGVWLSKVGQNLRWKRSSIGNMVDYTINGKIILNQLSV